jgi:hypothetical protein
LFRKEAIIRRKAKKYKLNDHFLPLIRKNLKERRMKMKKKTVFLIMLFIFSNWVLGQTSSDKKNILQAGIGLSPIGVFGTAKGLPLSLSFSHRMLRNISLGIYFGWSSSKEVIVEEIPYMDIPESGFNYGYASVMTKGSYHVDIAGNKNMDVYGFASVGYCIVSASGFGLIEGLAAKGNFFAYGLGAGVRYFFTPNIGVYGEAGYGDGINLIGFGISYKF